MILCHFSYKLYGTIYGICNICYYVKVTTRKILLHILIHSFMYEISFPTWREKGGSDISIANMVITGNYSVYGR